jgi:hypothetical protein
VLFKLRQFQLPMFSSHHTEEIKLKISRSLSA